MTRATFPLGPFTPYEGNPVLRPQGEGWESANLYNPAAIVVDDEVVLLYRAHGEDKVSRIGIARSTDGLHFERELTPVLEPEVEIESKGVEDPRITRIDGTYYLTYTAFDGKTALLCLATSTDLRTWTRHGPLFPDFDTWATLEWPALIGRTRKPWNKAGVIHSEQINGLWWMWFGEGGIYAATSPDLLHWTPCSSELEPLHRPTAGRWDADLVEIGAPPVVTDEGLLVLLTNGARIHSAADLDVRYMCGQIALPLSDPSTVIAELTVPWLKPETFEDTHGLVANVTFVQGLVHHRGRWLAYYGQSDTTLAVAVFDPATDSWK